jgi:hypothetical protein
MLVNFMTLLPREQCEVFVGEAGGWGEHHDAFPIPGFASQWTRREQRRNPYLTQFLANSYGLHYRLDEYVV